ncbi:MAG TPA: OmpH family outer membrane protein [Terriglobales bacterium]|jgi:outer membrane protein|nr:OmpH family outer membrane protein [Terriglobales bacterium]
MKRTYQAAFLMLTLLASASLFAQGGTAAAPGGSSTKIGVIDIQTAILATNEGQREFNNLTTKFQPKQTELQGLSKEVDDLQKQFDTQGEKLNEDARANLAKQLDTKKKNLQRVYEDAQSDFESQKNDILKTLGNKVYATLDKYAKDNGFGVIVDVSSPQTPVLWAAQSTNITKAIVDAYNVTSGVPAPPAPKPASATAPTTKPPSTSH